jgi:polysaccharide chain length determinant protein (PEP-CTERM system associated)
VISLVEQVLEEINGAWRFRWLAVAAAAGLSLLGWLVVFALPDLYEADAKVFVDTRTALKPVLQGLAAEQDVNGQLNYVRQSLLSDPQLDTIARQNGVLPAAVKNPGAEEKLLNEFSSRIDIGVGSAGDGGEDRNTAGTIYSITYRDRNRARSLRVVQTLLDKLVNETLGGKRAGSESAQKFLEAQIKDYEQRLSAAENRLADFKKRNIGLMPTEQGGYFAELQQEMQTLSSDEIKLQKARTRRDVIVGQLHGDVAVAAAGGAPATAGGSNATTAGTDINSQIAATQARLDQLRLRYTDQHPDVIAAVQTLKELKQRRAAEIESLKKGDAGAAAVTGASANPVYQSLEQQLDTTDLEIADLTTDLAQHRKKAADLRGLLDTAPQVEAQYAQLTRDYDVNTAEYKALLQNYEKARLGERADNAGSVRFDIVQPPTADFAPVWPKRLLLLAGVFADALIGGTLLAYGMHHLRPVFSSSRSLAELTGATVLGVVSIAFPERARFASRRDTLGISMAMICLVLAFAGAVMLSHIGFRLNGSLWKHLVSA